MSNSKLYKEIIQDLTDMADQMIPAKNKHDYAKMVLPTHKLANYIHQKVEWTILSIAS